MASKVTRTCLIAVSAIGVSGLAAVSAEAATAPPSIPAALVNQPTVAGASKITPESALLTGVVDTGGNPGTTFSLPAGTTLYWDNSFNLIGGSSATTEHVDGLPSSGSDMSYGLSSGSIANQGANNYSTVLFVADPASDYTANGDNFGPKTVDADETDVQTYPGLSSVAVTIGGYPAAKADPLAGPLKPNTKYVYALQQQAGATDEAETINTYSGSATGTNPTWSCYPLAYIDTVAPYSGYTSTGTISGGLTSTGTAQTTPQPQIQGPCVYYYGGSANYYTSSTGTFTTPKLGTVKVVGAVVTSTKKASKAKAAVLVKDASVESAKGTLRLTRAGKSVANAKFSVSAGGSKAIVLNLTGYGKKMVAEGKKFSTKLTYTTTTDQPTSTRSVTL